MIADEDSRYRERKLNELHVTEQAEVWHQWPT
jgi:hypothetical protein